MANNFKNSIIALVKYGWSPAVIVALYDSLNPTDSEKQDIFNLANSQYVH
jgi:hypothetical protein